MKDLYSFHANTNDLYAYYEASKAVYMNVYRRIGLGDDTVIAAASGGDFTDDFSHEFQTRIAAGEDTIFLVPSTGEAFNEEVAPSKAPDTDSSMALEPLREVEGKGIIGVEALAKHLGVPAERTTKTILYLADGALVAVVVCGTYAINELKLKKSSALSNWHWQMKQPSVRRPERKSDMPACLICLPTACVLVDDSCEGLVNFEMGANKTNYHSINVNWGRDLRVIIRGR